MALALLASACSSSNDAPVHTLEVTPGSAILVGTGDSITFEARIVDAEGTVVSDAPAVTWASSHSETVAINAAGEATAMTNIGSAMITASTGDLVSAPVLAAVAVPSDNSVLLGDDRFVSDPELVGELPDEISSGFQMRAVISGTPPAVDQLIIATGETPFAGRVVSVDQATEGSEVTVQLTSMAELFKELSIFETVAWDQSAGTQAASTKGNKSTTSAKRVVKQAGDPDAMFDIGPFECTVNVGVSVTDVVFNVTPVFDASQVSTSFIWLIVDNETTDFEAIIQGPFSATLNGDIELPLSFTSAIDCRDKAIEVPVVPPSGTLGLLSVEAFATIGIAFDAQASTVAARVLLDGALTGAGRIGVDYSNLSNDLPLVSDAVLENHVNVAFEFDDTLGDSAEVTLKPAIRASLGTQLKVGIFGLSKTFEIAEWIGTGTRELKYATVNRQIQNTTFAASETRTLTAQYKITKEAYKAMFAWTVSGPYAIEAIDTLINIAGVFGVSIDLNNFTLLTLNSPSGTLTAPGSGETGQGIDFSVVLQDVDDFDGYNVEEVRLYRHEGSGASLTSELLGTITPNEGDTNLVYTWTPGLDDVGDHRISAFVITKESPATPYELSANSEVFVTVFEGTDPPLPNGLEDFGADTYVDCTVSAYSDRNMGRDDSVDQEIEYTSDTDDSEPTPPGSGTLECDLDETFGGARGRVNASADWTATTSAGSFSLKIDGTVESRSTVATMTEAPYAEGDADLEVCYDWGLSIAAPRAFTISLSVDGFFGTDLMGPDHETITYSRGGYFETEASAEISGEDGDFEIELHSDPKPGDRSSISGVVPAGGVNVSICVGMDGGTYSSYAASFERETTGSAMGRVSL